MILWRFKVIKQFVPGIIVDIEQQDDDDWWQFSAHIEKYRQHIKIE